MQSFIQKIILTVKSNKLLSVAILGSVVIVIVGITVLASLLSTQQTSPKPQVSQEPRFTNYLKPTSQIKVGKYRYVSACQLLTPDDVRSIYGSLGDNTSIFEDFLDSTPQKGETKSTDTNCRYVGDREVALFADQYFDSINTDNLGNTLYTLGDKRLDEKVALYKKAVSSTNDKKLKEFVSTLEQSAKVYKTALDFSSTEQNKKVDMNKLVFPVDRSLFNFNIIKNNVVYRLEQPVKTDSDDEYKLSNKEIVDHLQTSRKALDLIKSRAGDRNLDQSPAPTIIGDTDKYGDTKILEPCALLTAQMYKTIAGSPENDTMSRMTVDSNTDKQRVVVDGRPSSPSNSCDRDGTVVSGNSRFSTTVSLSLRYYRTAQDLQTAMSKEIEKLESNDRLLQTNADWAGLLDVDSSNGPTCVFRVGGYSGSLSITHIASQGFLGEQTLTGGTDEQYVQLINTITNSIKKFNK